MTVMEKMALDMLQKMTGLSPEEIQNLVKMMVHLASTTASRMEVIEKQNIEILALLRGEMPSVIINGEITHAKDDSD